MSSSCAPESPLDVAVIGGGGAGLLAGIAAARAGARAIVFERNAQPGLKVALAGGGRCNFTNTYAPREFIRAFGDAHAGKLGQALRAFDNRALVELLERHGVRGVLEQGYRLYTASGRGRDLVDALQRELAVAGARLAVRSRIERVCAVAPRGFSLHGLFDGCPGERHAAAVVVCTGGLSYPGTGSTGDGHAWARELGHTVTALRPGLVGLVVDEEWPKRLSGLSCPDARVRLLRAERAGARKPLAEERAGLLFTHFGLSGPAVIDLSLVFVRQALGRAGVELDFFPDRHAEQLDRDLAGALRARPHGRVAEALSGLPERLREALAERLGEEGRCKAGRLSREARRRLTGLLKALPLTVVGTREMQHGEVTVGGVCWDEIDPATMQSRRIPGLYFAGEILDVAGRCGGFNLQAAFSTGYLAGLSAAGARVGRRGRDGGETGRAPDETAREST